MNTYENEREDMVPTTEPVESYEPTQPVEPVEPVARVRPAAYVRERAAVPTATVSPVWRLAQLVYVIAGIVITLIILRVILKALAANAGAGFTSFIYGLTAPLVAPFQGIFATPQSSNGSVFELSSIVAIIVYALVAWAVVRLIEVLGQRRTPVTY